MWWVITEDVCVCAASVLKNELQKVIQHSKDSKKRNAGGQPSTFSKDLKVRKQDFIHFYFGLHQFRKMSSQTNTLLITFIVCSHCKCRKTHCFHTCWLMFPPWIHLLSNKSDGPWRTLAEVTAVGFTKREWTSFIYRLLQKRDRKVSKAIRVIVFCRTQTARCFLMLICHIWQKQNRTSNTELFFESWNIWDSSWGTFHQFLSHRLTDPGWRLTDKAAIFWGLFFFFCLTGTVRGSVADARASSEETEQQLPHFAHLICNTRPLCL